jgi:hypothetical protein
VASGRRLIKRASLVLLEFVALLLPATGAWAQAPDENWRTLDTEHFRVTFPAELEELGRRAATVAEVAYGELSDAFVEPPSGRIDLLITDHTDGSNGYAQMLPSNRITVFARPPLDGPSLSYFDDWMGLVITHELAHIFHLDHTRNPIGRLLRAVFGRADSGWPYFPGVATPGWVIEGLATWYESELTTAGRTHGTFHEMVLRTAALEGRFESIGQAGGQSPLWPAGSRSYVYGSMFFEYLLDRYGEERMVAFVDAVAGQWIPYRLNAAGRSAFGVSLSDAWRAWTEEVATRQRAFDAALAANGPVSEPERLTTGARWAFYPSVSPDGATLAYARADGRTDVQLYSWPVAGGEGRAVGRTNGLSTFGWMPDGRLLFAQLEQDGPYRAYADLYVMDLGGATERITRGERLEQPSVAPGGTWAAAVQNVDGTNGLVRVDLGSGSVSPLVTPRADVHWAFPRVSPDGRWIAATRWEPGAYQDVVILDAETGREVHRLTRDRAVDLAAAWSPDSRWVVWSSDRTGVMNVLGAEVDPRTGRAGEPRLLTNVRTGVAYPSVDPEGRWLYVSGYHVDGWEAERIPFDPSGAPAAPAPDDRFAPPPGAPPSREGAPGEVEGYSVWPTLLPRYWQLRVREPVVEGFPIKDVELLGYGLGAETGGVDLVGRHAYGVYAQAFTSGGRVEGGLAYAYRGLGNPVISLRAEQRWDAAGTFLMGAAPDTLYGLELERVADASLTLQSARWRRSLSLTLGGGFVWETRELLGTNLQPSSQYRFMRPKSTLGELRLAVGYSTARTASFQTGGSRGLSATIQGRSRRNFGLPGADIGIVGVDRTFAEVTGRARAYVPLWGGGHAQHVLALQVAGGSAFGPGAQLGHFAVGGATGSPEDVTGLELFGGSYLFLPVRGYARSARYGRHAWASTAEYRFPIALLNRGLGAWPLHFDRVVGSAFVDAGNAWGPYPRGGAVGSVGAEVTVGLLGFFNSGLLLRTGAAFPLVGGGGAEVYVRAGLSF